MQTVYYNTANFIRHQGNMVDLAEYRRRIARAAVPVTESINLEPAERTSGASRARRRCDAGVCPGLFLDFCASGAIVLMTAVAVVQFLVL